MSQTLKLDFFLKKDVYTCCMLLRVTLCLLTALCSLERPVVAQAPSSLAAGPTTRVLAIGHLSPGTNRDKLTPIMPQEVRDTVRLYLAGKIDQWFVRRDQNGVVFLLNVSTLAEAHDLLENLPLGKAKLMEFDLIPLGPLTPLRFLFPENETNPK
jgi:hypothetical protein